MPEWATTLDVFANPALFASRPSQVVGIHKPWVYHSIVGNWRGHPPVGTGIHLRIQELSADLTVPSPDIFTDVLVLATETLKTAMERATPLDPRADQRYTNLHQWTMVLGNSLEVCAEHNGSLLHHPLADEVFDEARGPILQLHPRAIMVRVAPRPKNYVVPPQPQPQWLNYLRRASLPIYETIEQASSHHAIDLQDDPCLSIIHYDPTLASGSSTRRYRARSR